MTSTTGRDRSTPDHRRACVHRGALGSPTTNANPASPGAIDHHASPCAHAASSGSSGAASAPPVSEVSVRTTGCLGGVGVLGCRGSQDHRAAREDAGWPSSLMVLARPKDDPAPLLRRCATPACPVLEVMRSPRLPSGKAVLHITRRAPPVPVGRPLGCVTPVSAFSRSGDPLSSSQPVSH
jgi:hypothetical protein